MNSIVRDVGKENFALRASRRTFGKSVSFTHQLPAFARNEKIRQQLFRRASRSNWGRIVTPEPPQGIRQNRTAVLAVVSTVTPDVFHIVTGELQRGKHGLVRPAAVAVGGLILVRAVLQKH